MNKIIIPLILLLLILASVIYFNPKQPANEIMGEMPTPVKEEVAVIEETEETEETTEEEAVDTDQPSYVNEEIGFGISFPEDCEALDDETNLYGWSNGVVLIYCGGQAYDVAVEVWDTEDEYEAKYLDGVDIVEELSDGRYLTVVDMTKSDVTADILSSFDLGD
ncbi:hypothetical protein ACFL13_02565 [Patescibacteria group bacterium]